ncbi:TRAP transporter large permease [Anaerotruncus rubiinfantis]|jgi:C4-dicarboxylate transporter DctM subunit|uniref:TRAP transporter large permease n=1 Tax=Anaerotruncus rubiinfantis TaxID=1720200 RepID=UPI0008367FE9|nr:TRAP transporter large permease [Anaerotruncus rubiinfantis]
MLATLLTVMLVTALLTVPIGSAIGMGCLAAFLFMPNGEAMSTMLSQTIVTAIDNYSMLSMPFFMMVGTLMARGGLAKKLIKVADVLTCKMPGGLGMAAVVSCMFFAAISGSGPATCATIGGIMIEAMREQGYDETYAGCLCGAGSTIGPVIPPSIPMITYGVAIGVSISDMFMGGIVPGVLMGVALMLYNYFVSKKRGYKSADKKNYSAREVLSILKDGFPALLMPIIILGGIYSGIFTATEASVVGVAYAVIVSGFIYHSLSFKDFCTATLDAGIASAAIFFTFGVANMFARILSMNNVAQIISDAILSITDSRFVIMLILNILLIIIGMFVNTNSAIVLFGPIMVTIAAAVGVNSLAFGIIMVTNLCIGMVTPPVGSCFYISQKLSHSTFDKQIKELWPPVLCLYAVVILLSCFPQIITFLPDLLR